MSLRTGISEINDFIGFNYDSIFELKHMYFGYFTSPWVPIVSVSLYLILSKTVFSTIRSVFNLQPKGTIVQQLTILHSTILALYSIWTFLSSVPIVYNHIIENGFWETLCDANGSLWFNKDFGFWLTHFYISKYYEFIDTWIVLLKGRDPIFLQVFHHAGIVILMWGFVVTTNTVGLVIVCFNSFIHSLMYTYYLFAAMGYHSPLKHYLTMAQIIQFLLGMTLTLPTLFMSGCLSPAQSLVLWITEGYTVVLIALFLMFYASAYTKKKKT